MIKIQIRPMLYVIPDVSAHVCQLKFCHLYWMTDNFGTHTCKLDTCIMQTMLPQAMVVCEVSWHLTWVLSSAETHGACV